MKLTDTPNSIAETVANKSKETGSTRRIIQWIILSTIRFLYHNDRVFGKDDSRYGIEYHYKNLIFNTLRESDINYTSMNEDQREKKVVIVLRDQISFESEKRNLSFEEAYKRISTKFINAERNAFIMYSFMYYFLRYVPLTYVIYDFFVTKKVELPYILISGVADLLLTELFKTWLVSGHRNQLDANKKFAGLIKPHQYNKKRLMQRRR